MKKILTIAAAAVFALGFTSCEDQLDSINYTKQDTGNFPATSDDVVSELNGVYSVLNGFVTTPLQMPYMVWNLMSDDCNGGGGTGDTESHAVGHITTNNENLYQDAWKHVYEGLNRASTIIYSIDNVEWADQSERDQLLGETLYMRAFYMLWGTQMFGNIPAYWQAGCPTPCPQQDAETVIYPHIMGDLVQAASLMTKKTQGDGHATRYAAEALLARAYMFYQGFYKKAGELASANLAPVTVITLDGEQELTKDQVVKGLEDVINNGGYSLIPHFQELWQYTNEFTVEDYNYTKGQGLKFAGNGNAEQIFQIQFMNCQSWNGTTGMGYCNQLSLYVGLRCDDDAAGAINPNTGNTYFNGRENTFPFGQGWGQGTVQATLWDDWSDADPRKAASICDAPNELEHFVFTTSCTEDAGYYNKKLMPVTTMQANWDSYTGAGPYTWWDVADPDNYQGPKNENCMQGSHFCDITLIRLADVMLMHSELTGTADQMNKVRARAGLPATTYSWQNIKNERRFELAFEGVRFNDLRRWSGINGGESCEAAVALERQNGSKVNYCGTWTKMKHATSSWAKRYAETDGFLQIPTSQIELAGDEEVLKQNPGWGSSASDAQMSGTPVY